MGKEMLTEENENLQKKKRKKLQKKKDETKVIEVNINGENKVVKWYTNVVDLINTYGMKRMLQALLLIVSCVSFFIFINALNNNDIIETWIAREIASHNEGSNIRNEITPKVNEILIKMMYELEADRTSILEMHNGKENPTSLPFNFCDMTYEQTRGRIPFVSDEYENLNMSKFTLPFYLYEHKLFIGTIDEIYDIDKRLAMRLEINEVKYVGIIIIRGSDDIGFLMISYLDEPKVTYEQIHNSLIYYVQEVGAYLDYKVQHEERKKKQF